MRKIADLKRTTEKWRGLEKQLANISDSLQLAQEEPEFLEEVQQEVDAFATQLDQIELELAFSGEYDSRNAILSIKAGAGGTESQDWAEMLMRMYLRWAERRGYQTEILEISPGEETGIKSVTINISGEYCLRLFEIGARRPPPGEAIPLRCRPCPSYLFCPGRSNAGSGRGCRYGHQAGRFEGRGIPFQRPRRSAYAKD